MVEIYTAFHEIDQDEKNGSGEQGEAGSETQEEDDSEVQEDDDFSDGHDLEEISDTILNMGWGKPGSGIGPLLAVDPTIETLGLDCMDGEPMVIDVGDTRYWIVAKPD